MATTAKQRIANRYDSLECVHFGSWFVDQWARGVNINSHHSHSDVGYIVDKDNNAKTVKRRDGLTTKYRALITYLSPALSAGTLANLCPWASPGCLFSCLYTSGRARFSKPVNRARRIRTRLLISNPTAFLQRVCDELDRHCRSARKAGETICYRFNGTSDVPIEECFPELFWMYPDIQWYDYTKSVDRARRYCLGGMPPNYHLTFSKSETNWTDCLEILALGGTVSAVFRTPEFPKTYCGFPVIDGDQDDLRFLDNPGSIVALKAKGKAIHDKSGFVIAF